MAMTRFVSLSDAQALPAWRRPKALLFVMAAALPLAFATWLGLLNNFIIEVAGFDGADNGLLHMVREIPGFLAFAVVFLLLVVREQMLGLLSLVLLGAATALTAQYPTVQGILILTFLSSIGFHYFETVNQSLQLQWLSKSEAPKVLGWLLATGSAATFVVYAIINLAWDAWGLTYDMVYWAGGGATALIALAAMLVYPQFVEPHPQTRKLLLRRRYWLYYALQFLSGARRQIFVVFAGFMMVEKFGMKVDDLVALYLINLMVNMAIAPVLGHVVARFGERFALVFEYSGLVFVFLAYSGIYFLGWGLMVAAVLYVVDHIFFGLKLALKTYFQKIADPGDIAPTAAVAFTINHIAAVALPWPLGLLWLSSPGAVFVLAACMAGASLLLSLLIPRHPSPGNETVFNRPLAAPAE